MRRYAKHGASRPFVYLHYNPAGFGAINCDVKENARVSHVFAGFNNKIKPHESVPDSYSDALLLPQSLFI